MKKLHAVTVVFYVLEPNELVAETVTRDILINDKYLKPSESFQIVDVSELTNG